MKIAITGVPSTGKTTLSRTVAEQLQLPYMEEQFLMDSAFDWCDQNNVTLTTRYLPDFTLADVAWWQRGFVRAKYKFHSEHESYVADGCPLLTIMYVLTTCYQTWPIEEIKDAYSNLLEMARSYNTIFYLPFGALPIEDDGRRTTDVRFHMMQDLALQGLIRKHEPYLNYSVYGLQGTNFEARVNRVLHRVKPYQMELPFNAESELTEWDFDIPRNNKFEDWPLNLIRPEKE